MKKCAIYTRVSTSMQAEVEYNSCEAQRDRILSFIKSQEEMEAFKEYSDPGCSGGNLDRPGLKTLLREIVSGQIQFVLTYKIDRLTRSSKDFYSLIEFFEKYGVSFISVTERFDTSSPSGRLLRNIMLTFAQFEREMTSERIKDKFEQKALKGLWSGNLTPLGYKSIDKKLVVDPKGARLVKGLYEVFVETGSFKKVMEFAREKNLKHGQKENMISEHGVYRILRSPVYLGKIVWHGKVMQGVHEPIISNELFEEAQGLTKEKVRKKRVYKEFILSQLLKCAECGSSMTNTFTNKKKRRYYYYKCIKVVKHGKDACSLKEVNAEKLEQFLFENLERISKDENYIDSIVFKMLRKLPASQGFELSGESEKNHSLKILHVLQRYVSDFKKASQLEKCLITKKTIERINFSKESLEVIINTEDRTTVKLTEGLEKRFQLDAARRRAGAADSTTPACTAGSILNTGGPIGSQVASLLTHQDLICNQ